MLDLKYILEHPEDVRKKLLRRGESAILNFDEILKLGKERSTLIKTIDENRAKLNEGSKEVARKAKEGAEKEEIEKLRENLKNLGETIKKQEVDLSSIEKELNRFLLLIPNIPHDSIPDGLDSSTNRVERVWGNPPQFTFKPKPHWELAVNLGIVDFERAAKISGARFAVLKGAGSLLERALIQFMMDVHTKEHGYIEIIPPFLVTGETMTGTGQLPKFAEDLFKVENHDLYLIPTAEVPVTNLHANEILEGEDLPIKYCAWTPCFRSEAGSYGKDVRGLIRQHQFNKVELVKFCKPEDSYRELDLMVDDAADILARLGLHHRIVTLSAGDMGFSAAKCYDIEVWLPSSENFREISSCSNCEDFQARRAKIRYRESKNQKPKLVHTMNGSGVAVGRTMIAIMEQFQQEDGTILIPQALRPYMHGLERITPEI